MTENTGIHIWMIMIISLHPKSAYTQYNWMIMQRPDTVMFSRRDTEVSINLDD